jgi:predicted nucleic acid-binding protein
MTAVVSDTSPLNYLILIDAVDLLPRLFSEVYIPAIVAEELTRGQTPMPVRTLLIDERKGFQVAESLGLEPIGLLGILELCAARRWISFDDHVKRLRATTFRFHERLIVQAKRRLSEDAP